MPPDHFFLPFVDTLAGEETYPAGRYLEPVQLEGNTFRIDFNQAYNPYCAYGDNWSCPITPAENRLSVPIRAGEKLPQGDWLSNQLTQIMKMWILIIGVIVALVGCNPTPTTDITSTPTSISTSTPTDSYHALATFNTTQINLIRSATVSPTQSPSVAPSATGFTGLILLCQLSIALQLWFPKQPWLLLVSFRNNICRYVIQSIEHLIR